ncbi:MAG: YggS family pyridoxal phosphate-dependent enzyme [Actinomycetia bacterium]|nr:YggS family pyridoxal phosphate-dependent enzyme [Actinomycetes bacterium]
MSIKNNIDRIKHDIQEAALKTDRSLRDITIIGVTKNRTLPEIKKVYDAGIIHFGENKVQEFLKKYPLKSEDCKYHFIGHLQRNKVKYLLGKIDLIQSIDTRRLAEEIDKRAKEIQIVQDVLIEINIGKEYSKYGVFTEEIKNFLQELKDFKNIKIKGLMTMAPFVLPEETRRFFKKMKKLFIMIKEKNICGVEMKYLSMGMSNDFKVAVEEGSNMVRIGQAIFEE